MNIFVTNKRKKFTKYSKNSSKYIFIDVNKIVTKLGYSIHKDISDVSWFIILNEIKKMFISANSKNRLGVVYITPNLCKDSISNIKKFVKTDCLIDDVEWNLIYSPSEDITKYQKLFDFLIEI